MNQRRREFLRDMTACTAALACPCLFAAQQQPKKTTAHSLISVDAKVCGTCQHWKGERSLVDHGKRVKCQQFASGPCFRGPGFKYPAVSSAQSHGCITGKFYKRWVGLS